MIFIIFITSLIVFFALDMFWLGFVAKKFYDNQIGLLMKEKINWFAAIVFYILFVIALNIFVISPAISNSSMQFAVVYGLMFGFITYATYDLTNLAVLKDWPLKITIVDMIWGSVLSMLVSVITFSIFTFI